MTQQLPLKPNGTQQERNKIWRGIAQDYDLTMFLVELESEQRYDGSRCWVCGLGQDSQCNCGICYKCGQRVITCGCKL